jgi:hypothetical protein
MTFARLLFAAALGLLPVPAGADVFRSSQSWGAIAFAPEVGEWGWSRNYATRVGAELAALAACRGAANRGCELAVVVQAACGALALGRHGWGVAGAPDPQRARAQAVQACRQGSDRCTVQVEICASPPGAPIVYFR